MVNGRLDGYREGLQAMEWRLDGTVGPETDRWIFEQFELPGEFRLHTPYRISEALCVWKRPSDVVLKGTVVSPRGPRVSADLLLKPETVIVNDLTVRGEKSMASAGLRETKGAFHMTFRGRLEEKTLDELLVNNTILDGEVEGNLETRILLDRPLDSRAAGTLQAEGLRLPLPLPLPVTLEDFTLRAEDNKTTIEAARLAWEGQEILLEGAVSFSSEGFSLDLDTRAGEIEWARIKEALGEGGVVEEASPQVDTPEGDGLESLAVEGIVRVKAEAFTFEEFTWRPLEVEVLLQRDEIRVLLKEANLCGVSTTGAVGVLPDELSLDLEIMCENERIEKVLDCVRVEAEATGDFTFKMRLTGNGDPKDVLPWVEGDFEVNLQDGVVLEDPVVSAVLAFLNTTEVLRLKLPDYSTQGFPYNTFHIRGTIQNGVVEYEEIVIDGATVDIYALGHIDLGARTVDFRVLASSLQTVEFVFSKIPLISYLFGGRGVTAIPIRVYGPLDDPVTVPVSAAALGEDVLGIMGRTVGLPYAAIKWVLPKKKE
jgi:hypothetical protein